MASIDGSSISGRGGASSSKQEEWIDLVKEGRLEMVLSTSTEDFPSLKMGDSGSATEKYGNETLSSNRSTSFHDSPSSSGSFVLATSRDLAIPVRTLASSPCKDNVDMLKAPWKAAEGNSWVEMLRAINSTEGGYGISEVQTSH